MVYTITVQPDKAEVKIGELLGITGFLKQDNIGLWNKMVRVAIINRADSRISTYADVPTFPDGYFEAPHRFGPSWGGVEGFWKRGMYDITATSIDYGVSASNQVALVLVYTRQIVGLVVGSLLGTGAGLVLYKKSKAGAVVGAVAGAGLGFGVGAVEIKNS